MKQSANKCVICGAPIDGVTDFGANPAPIRSLEEGKCCSWCDQHIVIPARLKRNENGLNPYGDDAEHEICTEKADYEPEENFELNCAERVINLLCAANDAGVSFDDALEYEVFECWDGSASELLERLKRYILTRVFCASCEDDAADDAAYALLQHYI